MATELEEIKLQVIQANRVLADVGLATGVNRAKTQGMSASLDPRAPEERGKTVVQASKKCSRNHNGIK